MLSKPRTVLAHGCFDLLHLGHIRHLQQAKSWGDRLIVSITADAHVQKGLGRPHFNENERLEAVQAINCVDAAFVNRDPTPERVISSIKPTIYVKGVDYEDPNHPGHINDKAWCDAAGVEFRITKTEKWSSSRLINGERFSPDVNELLTKAREAKMLPRVLKAFEDADKLKITFVGEQIVDRYHYVRALGKSSKEFLVATVMTETETFAGGVEAAVKHGEWENADWLRPPAHEVIMKTRYVDADFYHKLFEVYSIPSIHFLDENGRIEFQQLLHDAVRTSDVLVVLDFGHGLMTGKERLNILPFAKFLAVNSQSNAGNYGFNPVTLYQRADYICIDAPEARLAASEPHASIDWVAERLLCKIDCPNLLITHGRNGSYYFGELTGYAPAFATGGIDTMGAGDAVLATTAPLVAAGLDLAAVSFVGNVVGAIKVSILGHRRHVNRQEIIATLESLLK